jgi:hypothetical protein
MEHYSCHKLAVIGDTYDFQVFVKLSLLHCGPHASVYLYSYYCMIAMRALEVQLWYFVYRIEHLCGQCRDTAATVSRWKKNGIILMQKSSNTITCSFKSIHTTQILLESIMQYRKILIGLLEHFLPFLLALQPIF